MEIHRVERIPSSRAVLIENLPFAEGEEVEITVTLSKGRKTPADNPYPLRGTKPYSYDDPFSPLISPDDWKVFE